MSSAATDCMAQFVAACARHNIQKKEKEHDSLAERAEKRAAKRAAKRTGKHAHLRACELRGHAERGGKARQAMLKSTSIITTLALAPHPSGRRTWSRTDHGRAPATAFLCVVSVCVVWYVLVLAFSPHGFSGGGPGGGNANGGAHTQIAPPPRPGGRWAQQFSEMSQTPTVLVT